ncbi:MAG: NF038122 family metalloprotease [Bryobacteraceae bacterium]
MKLGLFATLFIVSATPCQAITFSVTADATLSGNAAAMAAFQRATNAWGSVFSDAITVKLNAGFGASAVTDPVVLQGAYSTIRNAVASDAADEASNSIAGSLPTQVQFSAQVPNGVSLQIGVLLTQANAKALGLVDPVNGLGSGSDGTITFSNLVTFDFDNSDGVTAGQTDFETLAIREIGRILGFKSALDTLDGTSETSINLFVLDLFRFSSGNLPTNASQFTFNPRSMVPGAGARFSDTVNTWSFSTGVAVGDGNSGSYWKDDAISGTRIGVMDPTLPPGVSYGISAADIRALDLIGYEAVDATTPEPSTVLLTGFAFAALALRRRSRV